MSKNSEIGYPSRPAAPVNELALPDLTHLQPIKIAETQIKFNKTVDRARQIAHPALMAVFGLLRKLEGFTYTVEGKENLPDRDTPAIFISSHGGATKSGGDVALVMEALKERHMYPLIGEVIRASGFNRLILDKLNGDIPVDRFDKSSRQGSLREMIARINNRQNVLLWPEGSYNISSHLPTTGLFDGAAIVAQETGAPIVPIAKDSSLHHSEIRIDKPIYAKDFADEIDAGGNVITPAKKLITEAARAALSTMIWDLWAQDSKKWTKEEARAHYEELMRSKAWTGHSLFNLKDGDRRAVKKEKGRADPEEVDGLFIPHNPYAAANIYDHFGVGDK